MSLNVQRKDEGNHMSYSDDLNYLYSNRNTSQCSGEVIDSFLQKLTVIVPFNTTIGIDWELNPVPGTVLNYSVQAAIVA